MEEAQTFKSAVDGLKAGHGDLLKNYETMKKTSRYVHAFQFVFIIKRLHLISQFVDRKSVVTSSAGFF